MTAIRTHHVATGWRIWTLRGNFLLAPYLETPWPTSSLAAECLCPRPWPHLFGQPECPAGIYAYLNREDATTEGHRVRALLGDEVVLGEVELTGRVRSGFNPNLTGRGAAEAWADIGIITSISVVADWCRRPAEEIVRVLATNYRVPVQVWWPDDPELADYLDHLRTSGKVFHRRTIMTAS